MILILGEPLNWPWGTLGERYIHLTRVLSAMIVPPFKLGRSILS
jgi:hypothetical protein